MSLAPIAFFAYKRPEHTRRALSALAECPQAGESVLYIFCDGAKQPRDRAEVERVREVAASRPWCKEVQIIRQERNLGLAASIISGVSRLIEEHGQVIVLEDDIIVSPHFLSYMNEALSFYRDQEKVMHVAAYMYPVQGPFPETFFYRLASCWGWGTWKRAWDHFEPDPRRCLALIRERGLAGYFDHDGALDLTKMLQDQIDGRIDSWSIRWHASTVLAGGLCLHPRESYVENIGLDGSGTHCGSSGRYRVALSDNPAPAFSTEVVECRDFYREVRKFFQPPKASMPRRIVNKLRRWTRGEP